MAEANRPMSIFQAINLVVRNNTAAVDARLNAAGYPAGTDDMRNASLNRLLAEDADTLMSVLSVPLIPERMTPAERGQVIAAAEKAMGAPLARGGVFNMNGDPTEGVGELNLGTAPDESTGGGGGWNWNNFAELIVGAGLTVYLNETGTGTGGDGGNQGTGAPPPSLLPSWVVPVVVVAVLAAAAAALWYFTRKRGK